MSIQILKSYGTIQFIRQPSRLRKYGVPSGGALDPYTPSIVRAALAVGEETPVIEVMGTITFEARQPMSICWMTPQEGYVKTLAKWETCTITCIGAYAGYLGFATHKVPEQSLRGLFEPVSQLRYLPLDLKQMFEAKSTLDASRVGFKFESALPAQQEQRESEPVCTGLIQQTPNGQIIVLGPDGPVTGGYRKLGTLIQADFSSLALLKIQHNYEFIPVNQEIALTARKELESRLKQQCDVLRAIQQPGAFPTY